MNQQPIKTARKSSCSTKKSTKNTCKSANSSKVKLQSTLIKMNDPSLVSGNNSTLTQRNNTHLKCKAISSNPENEITARMKLSNKKLPKHISTLKTDRKVQYTKLKAKQIETELSKKQISSQKALKSAKKSKKESIQIVNELKIEENDYNKIFLGNDQTKIGSFFSEGTHKTIQAKTQTKKNLESFALSEIQRNQKQLIQKINFLEKQNSSLSQRNDAKFNQMRVTHDQEVNYLRQEMKNLTSKIYEHDNRNGSMDKKAESRQKRTVDLRQKQALEVKQKQVVELSKKLNEKDVRILFLQNRNKELQQELKTAKDSIEGSKVHFDNFEKKISDIQKENGLLQEEVIKCEKEKKYIKQNCVQVLALLREEFGEQLKFFCC